MATYVCSDIHGYYSKWKRMLKKIKFNKNDTMYILGDVIDRGPEPIALLKDILSRPNCILLMGNHEKMMLDLYKSKARLDIIDSYRLWIQNGGEVTYEQFESLPPFEQESILTRLNDLPIAIIGLEVPKILKNGNSVIKQYYLVHGSPGKAFYPIPSTLTQNNTIETQYMLWNRDFYSTGYLDLSISQQTFYKDLTVINGHTPTISLLRKINSLPKEFSIDNISQNSGGRILHSHKGHAINVDCGVFYKKSVFGCLRLDDWAEFYV